jgi:hypothetical protein
MARGLRWDKARKRDLLRRPAGPAGRKPAVRSSLPATEKQLRYIRVLRRQLDQPDAPLPALKSAASGEIDRLLSLKRRGATEARRDERRASKASNGGNQEGGRAT